MKQTNINLKNKWVQASLLVCLSFFALAGCGARSSTNSSDSTDLASKDPTSSAKPVAQCNRGAEGDVEFKLKAYVNDLGVRNNSLIRLQFVNVPDDYITQGYDIHIRKWTANLSGIVRPSSNEAPQYANVRFDYKSNGIYNVASDWNYNQKCTTCPTLEWANMQLIAKAKGQTYSNANAFFANFTLLLDLNDTIGDWKVLQVNFVDSKTGAAVRSINALIPTFDANPTDYAANHAPILSQLHPFSNMLNQNWASSQFQTESDGMCF